MLEKLIQQINEGVYVIDADTDEMVFANDRFFEITGLDCDYLGQKCYKKILDHDEICTHCIKARKEQNVVRNVRLPGNRRRFSIRGYNFSENGRNYHIEYLTDRTDLYEADKAYRESAQTLSVALEHSSLIFWEYDFETHSCYRGERYINTIGGPEVATDIPERLEDYHLVVKADMPKLKRLYNRLLKGEEDVQDEMRINYLAGVQWGNIHLTTIFDERHNRIKAVGTIENTQINRDLEESLVIVSEQNKVRFFTYDIKRQRVTISKGRRKGKNQEIDLSKKEVYYAFQERVHPLDLHILQNAYERILQGKEHEEITIRLQEKTSQNYDHVALAFTTSFDVDGKPEKILGSCKVINEQIKKEKAYKSQLAYIENYKKSSLAYVEIQVDKNKLLNVKTKYQSLRKGVDGHSIENWAELLCENVLSEEGKRTVRENFSQKKLRTQFEKGYTRLRMVVPYQLRPDYAAWLNFTVTLLLNPATSRLEGYVYISDETEAKQSETITNSIAKISYEVVVVIDLFTGEISDSYVFSNQFRNTLVTYKYYQESCEVQKRIVVEEERERVFDEFRLENIRKVMLKDGKFTDSFSIKGNDGKLYRKKVTGTRLEGFDTKMLLTVQDVSDIYFKELEKQTELSRALEKAEEAVAAKTEFLSRMSHDIRTPLNGVLGMARIAREETNEESIREYLDKIMTSGQLLISLVNDILDISKIEGHKMELHIENYDMEEFVSLIDTVIGEQCKQKNLQFIFDVKELENLIIYTDKLRFNQIFMNLLSNAVKYTQENGHISFSVKRITGEGKYRKMQFVVEDDGQGISKDFLKNAFEAFSQESVKITARRNGSGLGLAIVKQLVELMNGTVTLESEVGKGTRAIVTLTVQVEAKREKYIPVISDEHSLQGVRVLIAEDQELNAMIAKKILEKWGIEATVTENGQEAVDYFRTSKEGYFGAVLMDIRMPKMDGMEASRMIRSSNRKDNNIPIIAMTANAFAEDRKASMEAGMNAHLAKPINPEELFLTLNALIKP